MARIMLLTTILLACIVIGMFNIKVAFVLYNGPAYLKYKMLNHLEENVPKRRENIAQQQHKVCLCDPKATDFYSIFSKKTKFSADWNVTDADTQKLMCYPRSFLEAALVYGHLVITSLFSQTWTQLAWFIIALPLALLFRKSVGSVLRYSLCLTGLLMCYCSASQYTEELLGKNNRSDHYYNKFFKYMQKDMCFSKMIIIQVTVGILNTLLIRSHPIITGILAASLLLPSASAYISLSEDILLILPKASLMLSFAFIIWRIILLKLLRLAMYVWHSVVFIHNRYPRNHRKLIYIILLIILDMVGCSMIVPAILTIPLCMLLVIIISPFHGFQSIYTVLCFTHYTVVIFVYKKNEESFLDRMFLTASGSFLNIINFAVFIKCIYNMFGRCVELLLPPLTEDSSPWGTIAGYHVIVACFSTGIMHLTDLQKLQIMNDTLQEIIKFFILDTQLKADLAVNKNPNSVPTARTLVFAAVLNASPVVYQYYTTNGEIEFWNTAKCVVSLFIYSNLFIIDEAQNPQNALMIHGFLAWKATLQTTVSFFTILTSCTLTQVYCYMAPSVKQTFVPILALIADADAGVHQVTNYKERITGNYVDSHLPTVGEAELVALNDVCAVCQHDMHNPYSTRTLCQHYFHKECLRGVLVFAQTCPICRAPIVANDFPKTMDWMTYLNADIPELGEIIPEYRGDVVLRVDLLLVLAAAVLIEVVRWWIILVVYINVFVDAEGLTEPLNHEIVEVLDNMLRSEMIILDVLLD